MRTTIASFALLFIFIVISCKKSNKVGITYVPTYLKKMVPYTTGQAIRFIDSFGATLEAFVSMRSGVIEKRNCPTCDIYAREEYFYYSFMVGNHSFVQISVDVRPNVFMTIFSPTANFQTGGGFDFLMQNGVAQPICNGPRQTCLNSIVLNGQTFNNVLEIINGATGANQLIKAYYTVSQGLVGFKYGNAYTFSKI